METQKDSEIVRPLEMIHISMLTGRTRKIKLFFSTPTPPVRHLDAARCIAFDRYGLAIVSGSDDCTVKLWRLNPASIAK